MEKDIALSVIDTERRYSIPEYSESVYSTNAIVSYGKENDTPILLRNCFRHSATLKSVIEGYIPYILGEDIIVNEKIAKFAKTVNDRGMTMRQLIASISLDYMIYGGFAIQIILSKMGTIKSLYPLDFGRCRTNESGTKIWYSNKNWTKWGTKGTEFERYDPDKKQPTSIFYFKGDFTSSVYPLPPYAGAIYDVLTEIECAKYSLNTVARGFSAKYLIQFPENAEVTDEQKKGIEDAIKTKFCGSENETNFMLYWRNDDGEKIEVSKIESDETPERYIAIKDNARTNIFVAMRCTPLLMGLVNGISTGFATSEYRDSFKLFQKSVIEPQQDVIIESLDKIIGCGDGIHIVPFVINFDEE